MRAFGAHYELIGPWHAAPRNILVRTHDATTLLPPLLTEGTVEYTGEEWERIQEGSFERPPTGRSDIIQLAQQPLLHENRWLAERRHGLAFQIVPTRAREPEKTLSATAGHTLTVWPGGTNRTSPTRKTNKGYHNILVSANRCPRRPVHSVVTKLPGRTDGARFEENHFRRSWKRFNYGGWILTLSVKISGSNGLREREGRSRSWLFMISLWEAYWSIAELSRIHTSLYKRKTPSFLTIRWCKFFSLFPLGNCIFLV